MAWASIDEWQKTCDNKIQELKQQIKSEEVNDNKRVPEITITIINNFIDNTSWLNKYSEKLKEYEKKMEDNVIYSFINKTWKNYKKIKDENNKITVEAKNVIDGIPQTPVGGNQQKIKEIKEIKEIKDNIFKQFNKYGEFLEKSQKRLKEVMKKIKKNMAFKTTSTIQNLIYRNNVKKDDKSQKIGLLNYIDIIINNLMPKGEHASEDVKTSVKRTWETAEKRFKSSLDYFENKKCEHLNDYEVIKNKFENIFEPQVENKNLFSDLIKNLEKELITTIVPMLQTLKKNIQEKVDQNVNNENKKKKALDGKNYSAVIQYISRKQEKICDKYLNESISKIKVSTIKDKKKKKQVGDLIKNIIDVMPINVLYEENINIINHPYNTSDDLEAYIGGTLGALAGAAAVVYVMVSLIAEIEICSGLLLFVGVMIGFLPALGAIALGAFIGGAVVGAAGGFFSFLRRRSKIKKFKKQVEEYKSGGEAAGKNESSAPPAGGTKTEVETPYKC